jgi:hypothetical protein
VLQYDVALHGSTMATPNDLPFVHNFTCRRILPPHTAGTRSMAGNCRLHRLRINEFQDPKDSSRFQLRDVLAECLYRR